jgi:hypothetical protein
MRSSKTAAHTHHGHSCPCRTDEMKPCEGMLQVAEMTLGTDYDYPTADACGYEAEDQSQHHGTRHLVIATTAFQRKRLKVQTINRRNQHLTNNRGWKTEPNQ